MQLAIDDFSVAILVLGALAIIFLLNYYFNDDQRIRRILKAHKKRAVNSIQNKQTARLHGRALHVNQPLIAPFSGRECIYYQVIIQEKSKNGWSTVVRESNWQDFFIKSDDEMALIKAPKHKGGVRLFLVKDHEQHSDWGKAATDRLEQFLKKHNRSSKTLFNLLSRSLRYKEGIVALNEKVTVVGQAQWKSLSDPIEGYSYSKILTLSSSEKQRLIITDNPKHHRI
ncbi:MAG: hypothetical protein ABJM06_09905 [Gilvibacter sp.]